MGHTIPTLFVLLAAAVPLSAADCKFDKYYVSLPSNTCVSDGDHTAQGTQEHVLLYDTKADCCKGLSPKERRECEDTEVPSEVYPDFEQGRCSPSIQRPPVVHPTCAIDSNGVATSVGARFLRASLGVTDGELCCRNLYGGIDEAAVKRCVAKRGAWYWVAEMGCVRDDPLADDPVIYATAHTVGSLSACPKKYFRRATAFMCDDFTCPNGWTGRSHNIHCGTAASDCTKELCCRPTCSMFTCGVSYNNKADKDTIICPDAGCSNYHCCDQKYVGDNTLSPECNTETFPPGYPNAMVTHDWRNWFIINCEGGQIPQITIDSFNGLSGKMSLQLFSIFADGTDRWEAYFEDEHSDITFPNDQSPSRGAPTYKLMLRTEPTSAMQPLTNEAGFSLRYKCIDP